MKFTLVSLLGIFLIVFSLTFHALFFVLPVKWIWNYLINPQVTMVLFGVNHLTFWRSFWLLWLTGLLIRSTTNIKDKD